MQALSGNPRTPIRAVAALVICILVTFLPQAEPARAKEPSLKFPETGKTVSGKFLEYWSAHGGTGVQGLPISEEVQERSDTDGRMYTVQYFERAVFELHAGNTAPYDVLLSHLGAFRYRQKYRGGAPGQQTNTDKSARLFPETGKRVGCEFLDYWERTGGLAQHGYPISDELIETSEVDGKEYRVQYFERSVFEWHMEAMYDPGNRVRPFETVNVPRLGTARLGAKYPGQVPSGASTATPAAKWACAPTGQGPSETDRVDPAPVRSSVGKGHFLTGTVKSSRDCSPIPRARIVFWLAGPDGNYDDDHRATVYTAGDGIYRFESNFPAFYGAGGPHIHLYVSAEGYRSTETEIFLICTQTAGKLDVVLEPR